MAEHNDAQERTEQPSAKRQQDARNKGQVARSRELATVFVLFGGGVALYLSSNLLLGALADVMRAGFHISRPVLLDFDLAQRQVIEPIMHAVWALAPLLGAAMLLAVLGPLALGGWVLSGEALQFNFARLNPLKGLGRVLGIQGLSEMLKALAKFVLILALLVVALLNEQDHMLALARGDIASGLAAGGHILFRIFCLVSLATILLAVFDVPLQIWQHNKQLRMSRQDLREEMRETDGAPELKARIRSMQHELAKRRMMEQVPKADVIITNPEHYAVALKFDAATMRAPVVLAKGVNEVAQHIRLIAAAHQVQTVQAPPLARAIYHSTKVNREIPAGLYLAVARVLAYVFQLRAGVRGEAPADLPIPSDLAF